MIDGVLVGGSNTYTLKKIHIADLVRELDHSQNLRPLRKKVILPHTAPKPANVRSGHLHVALPALQMETNEVDSSETEEAGRCSRPCTSPEQHHAPSGRTVAASSFEWVATPASCQCWRSTFVQNVPPFKGHSGCVFDSGISPDRVAKHFDEDDSSKLYEELKYLLRMVIDRQQLFTKVESLEKTPKYSVPKDLKHHKQEFSRPDLFNLLEEDDRHQAQGRNLPGVKAFFSKRREGEPSPKRALRLAKAVHKARRS